MTHPSEFTYPVSLTVVGEDPHDPRMLLLLGDDGRYYAYSLEADETQLIEPDQRWQPIKCADEELKTGWSGHVSGGNFPGQLTSRGT